MSESTERDQSGWAVADLSPEERKQELPELSDKTPIIRYIRLSTLFLYLSNRAFIPSLECLQRLDDFEGRLFFPMPAKIHEFVGSLFGRFRGFLAGRPVRVPPLPPGVSLEMLDAINGMKPWAKELARRRAIWCWNLFESESNAMWQLYGGKGVAIKSTIGDLKKALASFECARRLIVPVRYGAPSGPEVSAADANFDPQNKATWPCWFMRPYLFKLPAYRYEQEIRFVFGIHPKLAEEASGVLVELDGKTLIREVSVSDSIPRDEARLIIDLWLKVKRDELPKLVYPLNHQDIWDERLRPLRGIPFTAEDDPAELFPI